MGKVIAFEWVSVDGVFDANYMEEWFFPYNSPGRQKIIKETYQQADAYLMGRETYEMLAPHWSQLSDEDEGGVAGLLTNTPKFIASDGSAVAHWGETTILEDAEAEVKKLKQKMDNIMIIGSSLFAESLAQAGLIDEYWLLVHPFIMGVGRTFFREGMKTPVQLVEAKELDQGILLLRYRVKK